MSGPKQNDRGDKALGLDQSMDRRDFLNSTLLASGGLLFGPLTPLELMAQVDLVVTLFQNPPMVPARADKHKQSEEN